MIKLHFWQLAAARATALLIGISVGVYWHELFSQYLLWLATVGVAGSLYVLYMVVRQCKK